MEINNFLKANRVDNETTNVILSIIRGFCDIYSIIQTIPFKYEKGKNSSGDTQINHDLLANQILHNIFDENEFISCYVSEENEDEICFVNSSKARFKLAVDPLDGSSVVAHNVSVGTCLGIYEAEKSTDFLNLSGNNMTVAMYAVYGPRLLVGIGIKNHGFGLFRYDLSKDNFVLELEKINLGSEQKICSFGGLQNAKDIKGFADLINFWQNEKFKVRYTGSMATDVNAIFMRGGGVFVYPEPKLRKLYECNPFALLTEILGGMAVDSNGNRILDQSINKLSDSSSIILGNKSMVMQVVDLLKS